MKELPKYNIRSEALAKMRNVLENPRHSLTAKALWITDPRSELGQTTEAEQPELFGNYDDAELFGNYD